MRDGSERGGGVSFTSSHRGGLRDSVAGVGGGEWLYPSPDQASVGCVCIHRQTLRWPSQRAEWGLGPGWGFRPVSVRAGNAEHPLTARRSIHPPPPWSPPAAASLCFSSSSTSFFPPASSAAQCPLLLSLVTLPGHGARGALGFSTGS